MTKPIPHGTNSGYQYHKCRCDECKQAHSEYQLKRKLEKGWVRQKGGPVEHGTTLLYGRGCRCVLCTDASRTYGKASAAERARIKTDTKLIETERFRGLTEEALKAFSADPGYLFQMVSYAAAKASSSLPQAQ